MTSNDKIENKSDLEQIRQVTIIDKDAHHSFTQMPINNGIIDTFGYSNAN
jgi:hypothetical protein